jgi:hypothetical protein
VAERKAEYATGKYSDGYGPGKAGLWFVRRVVTETIAFAESNSKAQEIAEAFRKAEHEQPN